MARLAHTVAVALPLACALAAAGCGEPLVVLGDAPGLMRIVMGAPDSAGTRVDTLATRTRLTEPRALAFDVTSANLYVADRGSIRQAAGVTTRVTRIFQVGPAGRSTLLLDGGGCTPGPCLFEATAMALAPDGALLIADAVGSRIFRYEPGGALTVLAGTGVAAQSPDGVPAGAGPVDRPSGIAVSADGRVHFSEFGADRVRVIRPDGTLATVAGTGERGTSGDGGAATAARLNGPTGITMHGGTIYIAEQGSHTVRAVQPDGVIRTVAGMPGLEGFHGDGGPATAARLSRPYAVAVSGGGRALFITDRANFRVRVVDLRSGLIRTFAGTGERRFNGARLTAGRTAVGDPLGLDATPSGLIFIADAANAVVWRTSVGFD